MVRVVNGFLRTDGGRGAKCRCYGDVRGFWIRTRFLTGRYAAVSGPTLWSVPAWSCPLPSVALEADLTYGLGLFIVNALHTHLFTENVIFNGTPPRDRNGSRSGSGPRGVFPLVSPSASTASRGLHRFVELHSLFNGVEI